MFARKAVVVALAMACHGAMAQVQVQNVPPALTVQRLAPQLLAFAGSEANFQNLVNGLVTGSTVNLVTVLPNGFTQSVSFTPTVPLSPVQAAQILESARQQLIGLGIGNPTAEQLAFTLMGGVVPTAFGGTQVNGQLQSFAANNPPSPAAQIQAQTAGGGGTANSNVAGTTTTTGATSLTSSVNVQTTPTPGFGATSATLPRPSTSDSALPAGATSRSPTAFTSASPVFNSSASPVLNAPVQAPGLGSTPIATERVPPNSRPIRN